MLINFDPQAFYRNIEIFSIHQTLPTIHKIGQNYILAIFVVAVFENDFTATLTGYFVKVSNGKWWTYTDGPKNNFFTIQAPITL